jgi:hypothetical protein
VKKPSRDIEGRDGSEGLCAQFVGAHRTDEGDRVTETPRVNPEVERRPAQAAGVIEHVPQHLANCNNSLPLEAFL